MSKENDPGLFCFSMESLMVGKEKKNCTSCTLNCVSIFLIFLKNLYLIKMYISVEKSINKNTRGNFSQDCRLQSYTLHLWRFVDIIKNGYWFFSFSKFTFHLKSKHCTMSQYNNRGLPLFLITPSQIKMYKTVNISLVYLYWISLLWSFKYIFKQIWW